MHSALRSGALHRALRSGELQLTAVGVYTTNTRGAYRSATHACHTRLTQSFHSNPGSSTLCSVISCLRNFVAHCIRAWHAKLLFLFGGHSFRSAVQFNNNFSEFNGGGVAVTGGNVT